MHHLINQTVKITFGDTSVQGVVLGFSEGFLVLGKKEGDTPSQYINLKNIIVIKIVGTGTKSPVVENDNRNTANLTPVSVEKHPPGKLEFAPSTTKLGTGAMIWQTTEDRTTIKFPRSEWPVLMLLAKSAGRSMSIDTMAAELSAVSGRQVNNAVQSIKRRLQRYRLDWLIVNNTRHGYFLSEQAVLSE